MHVTTAPASAAYVWVTCGLCPAAPEVSITGDSVGMGIANDVSTGTQSNSRHGGAAQLPNLTGSNSGYVVTFNYDLSTWDSYNATSGYWDSFSVSVTGQPFWQLAPSDPLTSTNIPGLGFVWGGNSYTDGVLERSTGTKTIVVPGTSAGPNYLNVILDTATAGNSDSSYPSWGTITITSVSMTNLCTVNQAQPQGAAPSYNSFASAWRCSRTSSLHGTAVGAGATFRPGFTPRTAPPPTPLADPNRNELGDCPDENHTQLSLTLQFSNQSFAQGFERISAFGTARCFDFPNEMTGGEDPVYPNVIDIYWGLQHDGAGMRFFEPIDGSFEDEIDAYADNGSWSVYITPDPVNAGAYNIHFGAGERFQSNVVVTNIGGMSGLSAEQYVQNNHRSIPGSTRHRAQASNLQSLEKASNAWTFWPSGQTGTYIQNFAGVTALNSSTYCLRTGDLGPNCP